MKGKPRVGLLRYTDQRCDDIQRECGQIRADQDRATHGLHAEMSERHRLLDEEMDRRIGAVESRHDSDLASLKDQTEQSRAAMEHRLEGMNEFRDQLREQATRFMTREVMDGIVGGLRGQDEQQEDRLRALEARITAGEGGENAASRLKSEQRARATTIVAVVTVVVLALTLAVTVVITTRGH